MKKILLFIVLISLMNGCASQNSTPVESTAQPVAGNMKNRLKAKAIKPSAVVSRPISAEKYYKLYSQYVDGKYSTEEFIDICNKEIDTALLNDKTIAELYGYIALAAMKELMNNGTKRIEIVYAEATKKAYRYDDASVMSAFLYALSSNDQCEQYNLYKYISNNVNKSDLVIVNKNNAFRTMLIESSRDNINKSTRSCVGGKAVIITRNPDNTTNLYYNLNGSPVSGVVEIFQGEERKASYTVENGLQHGISKEYEKGKLQNVDKYEDGYLINRTGYYPSGTIQAEYAPDMSRFYYENGKLNAVFFMRNGDFEGKYESYFENGKVEEAGQYKNNVRVGKFVGYFEKGQLKSETHYKGGVLDGENTIFYENGKIKITGQYKNGIAVGTFQIYYKSGALYAQLTYKDGSVISSRAYRQNGKLLVDDMKYLDDKAISGYCVSEAGVRVPLTTAEITNWNNGYDITCP